VNSSKVAKDTKHARVSPVRIDADLLQRVRVEIALRHPGETIKGFVESAVVAKLPARRAR
jgi:hypothetical protein